MPSFWRKPKSSSLASSPAISSVEHLPFPPSNSHPPTPRHPDGPAYYRRFSDGRFLGSDEPTINVVQGQQQQQPQSPSPSQPLPQQQQQYHPQPLVSGPTPALASAPLQSQSQPPPLPEPLPPLQPPPSLQNITRSQSHHQFNPVDQSLVNSVVPTPAPAGAVRVDADPPGQSWSSAAASGKPSGKQVSSPPKQEKQKKKIFGGFSSSSSSSPSGFLERSRSVKGSITTTTQPVRLRRHQQQLSLETSPITNKNNITSTTTNHNHPYSSSETTLGDYVVDPRQKSLQSLMQQDTGSPYQRPPRSSHPPSIQRSNTDSSLLEKLYTPSPVDTSSRHTSNSPRITPNQSQTHLQPSSSSGISQLETTSLNARPPSRQSIGPPSPLRPLSNQSDGYHQSGMAAESERQPGAQQGQVQNNQGGPVPSFPQGSSQQNVSEQPGRSTPPTNHRRRDETHELEPRALQQKYDDLQAKYSKVKRYYFEKDAQVQLLQNTVAHQRMAVSRTVLDDNEYAGRFSRLDGAVKDLAFSIRKDWKTLPSWFAGYVNEDAHTTGTKEMTAIGRATMSRWLVEEVFDRYFHPALEPTLSLQLKNIEMNLRRQQAKTYTEEDKENAIARISNWRRTTLDGLADVLQGKTAEENRSKLIEHLVSKFVATLGMNVCEPPPVGLENSAQMIVENALIIAEKIPLESRDICVEYFMPGTVFNEGTMKVETGLPLLKAVDAAAQASVDQEIAPTDGQAEEGEAAVGRNSLEGGTSGQGRKKLFSTFTNKRPSALETGPVPGAGPATKDVRESEERNSGQIRFASFLSAEVRGRGPINALMKAPVYLI